jgi:DNA-binding NtrC family response regulator
MDGTVHDPDLLDASRLSRSLVGLLERVGHSDEHVVVSGSSAVERELFAKLVHAASPRRAGPFVVYDSARAGSVTVGARSAREPSAFVVERAWSEAMTGTLYVVEANDLSDCDQARLLRALESRDVRAGTSRRLPSPVRVIASTDHDLGAAARDGRFRSSLFHRLNVMSIRIPDPCEDSGDVYDAIRQESFLTFKEEKSRLLEAWEPEYLRELLHQVGGNLALAARTAGIARAHLYRLLKKYGLAR